MIRVREVIERLSKYNPETIVSIGYFCYDDERNGGRTLLLNEIKDHKVYDMPAVLLCGDTED